MPAAPRFSSAPDDPETFTNAPTEVPKGSGTRRVEKSYLGDVRTTLIALGSPTPDIDIANTGDFWERCQTAGVPPNVTATTIYATERHKHASAATTLREAAGDESDFATPNALATARAYFEEYRRLLVENPGALHNQDLKGYIRASLLRKDGSIPTWLEARNLIEGIDTTEESPTREEWEVTIKRSGGSMDRIVEAAGRKPDQVVRGNVIFGEFYDDEKAVAFARKMTNAGFIAMLGPRRAEAAESGKRLYHGSAWKLEPGTILSVENRPRGAGTHVSKAEFRADPVEKLLEQRRPRGAVDRSKAVFAVERKNTMLVAGALSTDHAYVVEPIGKTTRADYAWVREISKKHVMNSFRRYHVEKDPEAIKWADNFWAGKNYVGSIDHGVWEVMAYKLRVIKEIDPGEQAESISRAREPVAVIHEPTTVIHEAAIPWIKVSRDPKLHEQGMALAQKYGPIANPQKVYELLGVELGKEDQEIFLVLPLNLRGELKAPPYECARGQRSKEVVGVEDVMRAVLDSGGEGFICVHNHPSGDPTPSKADIDLTDQIKKATLPFGNGIKFLDHCIVGTGACHSIFEKKTHRFKK